MPSTTRPREAPATLFAATEGSRCKGTMFLQARAFVTAREGDAGWQRLAARVDDASGLGGIVPIGWYAERGFVDLLHALEGAGIARRDLARYEAEQDLTVIHRMFLRMANPAYVLEKAGAYWSRFHDTGSWTVTRRGDSSAEGALSGWGIVDRAACDYLGAYIQRMFELVGARDVTVEHTSCRASGGEACVFRGAWR